MAGLDSADSGNITATLVLTEFGGAAPGMASALVGPPNLPDITLSNNGMMCLDGITPVQMSIINNDPTYAGGTQTYTVYMDIVYMGRSTPGC
jgi:hypothetical protein